MKSSLNWEKFFLLQICYASEESAKSEFQVLCVFSWFKKYLSETMIAIIIIIINLFQEIKDRPEFHLKEIQTGITFFSTVCIGNEEFSYAMKSIWVLPFFFFQILLMRSKFIACVSDRLNHWYSIYGFEQGFMDINLFSCSFI